MLNLFLLSVLLLVTLEPAKSLEWTWHKPGSANCQTCDVFDYTQSNFTSSVKWCSKTLGNADTLEETQRLRRDYECVSYAHKGSSSMDYISRFVRKIGDNGIIIFVGDSNVRNVFTQFLSMFGQSSFIQNMESRYDKHHANLKELIHHTYLCPKQFDLKVSNSLESDTVAKNVTVAFIWDKFVLDQHLFWNKRPWSQVRTLIGVHRRGVHASGLGNLILS